MEDKNNTILLSIVAIVAIAAIFSLFSMSGNRTNYSTNSNIDTSTDNAGAAIAPTCTSEVCTVQPSKSCTNDCAAGQNYCSGNYSKTCGQYDADKCLDWSPSSYCTYGCNATSNICNQPPSCNNECSPQGNTTCSGNNILTCGQYDTDPCWEWNITASCQYGCSNGACVIQLPPTNTCFDSDGPGAFNTYGNVSGLNNSIPYVINDFCSNSYVKDWYCTGTTPMTAYTQQLCTYGCNVAGTGCNQAPVGSCTDSDGPGNFLVSGNVAGINASGFPYTYYDFCANVNYSYDWQCSGVNPVTTNQYCAYGCNMSAPGICNQAPAQPTCTNDCSGPRCVAGSTQSCGQFDADLCLDWNPTITPCANGCNGQTGACYVHWNSCIDADGGQNFYVNSTVSGWYQDTSYIKFDKCNPDYSANITEYYCQGNLSMSNTTICPGQCVNGKCI